MDAITKRYWEIEGYRDLAMWDEVQSLMEECFQDIPTQPHVLGILATLGVAIEFGDTKNRHRPAPLLSDVVHKL